VLFSRAFVTPDEAVGSLTTRRFVRESALKEEVLVELAELFPEFSFTGRRMERAD
jgi:hypothetical protein